MTSRTCAASFITREELMSLLRLQGVEDIDQVRRAFLEGSGDLSVVRVDEGEPQGTVARHQIG